LLSVIIVSFPTILKSQTVEFEKGIIGLMYHRFEENKYPSTNVRIKEFIEQIEMVRQNNLEFISYDELRSILVEKKNYEKKYF